MLRINGSATVAVWALVVGSLVPTALAGSSDNRVQKPQQSTTSAARDLGPTWKTFSTTVGRGTKIVVSKTGNITTFVSPNVGAQTYDNLWLSERWRLRFQLGAQLHPFATVLTAGNREVWRSPVYSLYALVSIGFAPARF